MTNCQFWIQTSVAIAGVVATLIIAALAIWGQRVRARWAGPKLTLRLLDPQGERIDLTDGTNCRFYHLQVTNWRRSSHAQNVRVVLTKVSRPAADGSISPNALSGPIQLTWQHGHSLPQYLTLGPPQNADLGNVTRTGVFKLSPIFFATNLNAVLQPGERMEVETIAVSDETESAPLCVSIAWDGTWAEDATQMTHHLTMKEVACS